MGLLNRIFVIVSLSASPALADVNGSADIMNLNYYPHAGFFLLDPQLGATVNDHSYSSTSNETATTYTSFTVAGAYGVRPGVRLALSETILWDQVDDSGPAATGGESANTTAGFSAPTVTASWRVVEDERSGISSDAIVALVPSFGPKIPASAASNIIANDYTGSPTVAFTTSWFWRRRANELGLLARGTHTFDGFTNGNTDSTNLETLPSWTWEIELRDRLHLGENFFAEGAATVTFSRAVTANISNGNQRFQQYPTYLNPELEIGWRPDPLYVLGLTATYHDATVTTMTNTTSGTSTSSSSESSYVIATLVFEHQL